MNSLVANLIFMLLRNQAVWCLEEGSRDGRMFFFLTADDEYRYLISRCSYAQELIIIGISFFPRQSVIVFVVLTESSAQFVSG